MSRPFERFHPERSLAPNVDATWAETLLMELRLLKVSGPDIGAALSEVESHCTESGQSAQEAFGDATEYARCLELPAVEDEPLRTVLRSLAPMAVQMVGMTLVNWGFEDWLPGHPLGITAGQLVGVVITCLGIVLVIRFIDPLMRGLVRAPWRTGVALWIFFMANTAVCVAALMLLDEAIWRVPASWALAAGVAFLAAGMGWAFAMRSKDVPDLISSPFDKPGSPASGDEPGLLTSLLESHLLTVITMAMIPVATVFLQGMTLLIHLTSPK